MELTIEKPRLRLLLDHVAAIEDDRASWRVMYPLHEVLFLVVCATIWSCDDRDEIVDWGEARLDFLRRYLDFHWGVPRVDWLRTLMNRVDPELFSACFMAWVADCWPDRPGLVALDGKTSRGSHDRKVGQAHCTWSRPSPPTRGWCWGRKPAATRAAKSRPSRPCSTSWPRPAR